MNSYYDILNISETASDEDIKKAFRKQAMKWHPDRNPGNSEAEEKFKEMKAAYEILIDPYKRKQYDISRETEKASKGFNKDFNNFFKDNFADSFNENKQTIKSLAVELGFWEAISGCTKIFELDLPYGETLQKHKVTISIPAGARDGETFLFQANNNTLEIHITIIPDEKFSRNNLDLFANIEVPFTIAALGGKLLFPHWEGDLQINIPPGIKPNQNILVPNKGVKRDMFLGDLYLMCNISVPQKLTVKQKVILEEFKKTESEVSANVFESIKNTWKNTFKS
jgi:DnaJ-class molecular chaperone